MRNHFKILITAVILVLTLTSCVSALSGNPMSLMTRCEDNGYAYIVKDADWIDFLDNDSKKFSESVEVIITCAPGVASNNLEMLNEIHINNSDEKGNFIFCKTSKEATALKEELEKYAIENESFGSNLKRFTIKKKGVVVYYGCEYTWNKFD